MVLGKAAELWLAWLTAAQGLINGGGCTVLPDTRACRNRQSHAFAAWF